MEEIQKRINEAWELRTKLQEDANLFTKVKSDVEQAIGLIESGKAHVSEKKNEEWVVNEWLKKAILLNFTTSEFKIYDGNCQKWYDKVDPKFMNASADEIAKAGCRVVPGAFIRKGTHIAKNAVIMPSFINIGASVGEGTLVDTWATIGSCANIGKNCHISGGAGIGGVLEPLQATPVIIEDNCFIGARSEIVEGVVVGEGAVLGMGVFIGMSTKIVYRDTGEVIYGKVPPYSVVVPGTMPSEDPKKPSLYCAVIIKQVDEKTRSKTSLNELLRN